MLRPVGAGISAARRLNSNFSKEILKGINFEIDAASNDSGRDQRSFGQIVNGENANNSMVIDREQLFGEGLNSDYRTELGDPIRGGNAQEARLTPQTLQGRSYRGQLGLDPKLSKAINNHILLLQIPNNIRRSSSNYFVEMHQSNVHRPARTKMEVDSHIASIFLQNYGALYQSLAELQKRSGVEQFNPKKVLDVGYGPATGMVALNDLMGEHFNPDVKHAVILSHLDMEKKAKIILSRQLSEVQSETETPQEQPEEEQDGIEDDIKEGDDMFGEVMTKRIKINTKLKNSVPDADAGQYDLIMLTHQLLKSEERFPIQIDYNLEHFLGLLAPGGHMIIVEKGNPLGFEIIARARQIMIRPENYLEEHGKIPRPYNRGSSGGYHVETGNQVTKVSGGNVKEAQRLMVELDKQFGPVKDRELEFEPELIDTIVKEDKPQSRSSYHLTVVAPCPHHRKCPLQLGKPQYYEYPEGKNLKFCNFQKSIVRPKYTMEHKKGKLLATPWQEPTDGIGKKGLAKPGTGRPNGRNYEVLNYSYLIMERSNNDAESVKAIEDQRANAPKYEMGSLGNNTQATWPRIINQPLKRKGHVVMDVCGASGELEKWAVPKSYSKEAYHDARKAVKGDLWALGAKTKMSSPMNINVEKFEAIEKANIRKLKKEAKRKDRQMSEVYNELPYSNTGDVDTLAQVLAHEYQRSHGKKDKKYSVK